MTTVSLSPMEAELLAILKKRSATVQTLTDSYYNQALGPRPWNAETTVRGALASLTRKLAANGDPGAITKQPQPGRAPAIYLYSQRKKTAK